MVRAGVLILVAALALGGLFVVLRPGPSSGGPEERTIEMEIRGEEMRPDEVSVGEGDEVTLSVNTDHPVELHVHGYDLEQDVEPGEAATLSFEADKTGRFEIEDEQTATGLGTLVVEPLEGG